MKVNATNFGLDGETTLIQIEPKLADYPTLPTYSYRTPDARRRLKTINAASLSVTMPIKFELCKVTTVTTPTIAKVIYPLGTKAIEFSFSDFVSVEGDECNLFWTYSAELENGDILPSDMITFEPKTRAFKVEAKHRTWQA